MCPLGGEVFQITNIFKHFHIIQITRLKREQNRKVLLKEYEAIKVLTNKRGWGLYSFSFGWSEIKVRTVKLPNWKFKEKHKVPRSICLLVVWRKFILRQILLRRLSVSLCLESPLVFSHTAVSIIERRFKHPGKI